jgi:tetratricopeptide (TPR) repeat protein
VTAGESSGEPGIGGPAADPAERYRRLLAVAATREDRLVLLGRIGEAESAAGHWREAEATLRLAVTLADDLADRRASVANRSRLATALTASGRHVEAAELFDGALADAVAAGSMTDLEGDVCADYGRCLAEMGRRDEAVLRLRRALEIRRVTGDRAAVAATEKAIDALGGHR